MHGASVSPRLLLTPRCAVPRLKQGQDRRGAALLLGKQGPAGRRREMACWALGGGERVLGAALPAD